MSDETKAPTIPPKPEAPPKPKVEEFIPRKLAVVVGGPRGQFLIDADTGEDLRLDVLSLTVHWASRQSHADGSFIVQRGIEWKQWQAEREEKGDGR